VNVHHDDEARKTKNGKMTPPTWRAKCQSGFTTLPPVPLQEQRPPSSATKCRSGFTTLPPVPLQEQPTVVLLLEGHRSVGELAIREYGGHEDLRGSGRRSVIPYVHG
jgi:hypothetical protein